jgi:phage anti-repressor protein
MNDLIVIKTQQIGNEEINSVDARDLHGRLGLRKDFSNWIKGNIAKLNLVENVDYVTAAQKGEGGKFAPTEYILTIDAGKHISMMTNTETAHAIRTYFIEFEKRAKTNQPPAIPLDPILAIVQAVQLSREKVLALESGQHVLATGLAETRDDITKLKEHIKLEPWQAHNVQKAVARKVELWKENYPDINVKKAFPAIYRHLKEKFSVPTYTQIPAVEYERAMTVVTKLNMSGLVGL